MPRVSEAKALSRTQFYHPQSTSPPTDEHHTPRPESPATTTSSTSTTTSSRASSSQHKKKHLCPICERGFSTSGHLARHSRVHTGERQHKCPFPGCETACSRQDNLQQHYRIHLSPGSRRSSAQSAISRAMNHPSRRTASQHRMSLDNEPPPLSCPPALEPARVYYPISPPNSPPALIQATLPAASAMYPSSHSRGPSSSPQASYAMHLHQMPASSSMPLSESSYGAFTPSPMGYQTHAEFPFPEEEKQDVYVYPEQAPYPIHAIPHIKTSVDRLDYHSQDSPVSATSVSSRHSLSHISHPHRSYVRTAPSSPASSRSVSSHASNGPATPMYTFQEEYQHHGNMLIDHSSGSVPHSLHLHHQMGYHGGEFTQTPRCESPTSELVHLEDSRVSHYVQHQSAAYGSFSDEYPSMHPQQHGSWRSDGGRIGSVSGR